MRHYLFLENGAGGRRQLRLFPDGNTGIVFSSGHPLTLCHQHVGQQLPASFAYGQIGAFRDIYCTGKVSLMIVVLRPYGMYALTGIAGHALSSRIAGTEELFGRAGAEVQEALALQAGYRQKIGIVEKFLQSALARHAASLPHAVPAAVDLVARQRGLTTVQQLAAFSGCRERQVERKFLEYIGLPPKQYSSIVQLHAFLKHLKAREPHHTLTGLGYDAGYYDQAHLIRTFKKYTGLTPTHYIQGAETLAVNFLELLPPGRI